MSKKLITLEGKIIFDPMDRTNKHMKQSSWKRIAMVKLDGDICDLYTWFIERRYNLKLNKPLRGAHISFINDSIKKLGDYDDKWRYLKEKWDGKTISITLSVDPNIGPTGHWWLTIPEEYRKELHSIRKEVGLGRPYYGLHMSIGYSNEKNIEQSKYIDRLIKNFGRNYL